MSSIEDILSKYQKEDLGNFHPINKIKDFLIEILEDMGFQHTEGPEIESEDFNFDMLNIKKTHPARQMHDTFYIENKSNVLRTHTSPVQIHAMLKNKPPISFISSGKVYRKDDDATHLPMFHQLEGIYVNSNVNFSMLKDLIYEIIEKVFPDTKDIRFRPSYFPFTEPSVVDIKDKNGIGRNSWMWSGKSKSFRKL